MRFTFRQPAGEHECFTDSAAASLIGQQTTINVEGKLQPASIVDAKAVDGDLEIIVDTADIGALRGLPTDVSVAAD